MESNNGPTPTEAIVKPRSAAELTAMLAAAAIDVSVWGNGTYKSVDDLLAEVREGESVLWYDQYDRLRRNVRVVWADVWCQTDGGQVYRLEETMQVWSEDNFQSRILPASLGEKMKNDETPADALTRGLQEELSVGRVLWINFKATKERPFMPRAYPGLSSDFKEHFFDVWLHQEDFRPAGYYEKQVRKTSYFEWFDLPAAQAWRHRRES